VEGVESARLQLEQKLQESATGSGDSLRAATGALIEEVARSVAEATHRFAATAEEMRAAAEGMQRELNQTREELQKGILEMPAEAREASVAMRAAIGEQIEAINELSKIVARYVGESAVPAAPPAALAASLPTAGPADAARQARPRSPADEAKAGEAIAPPVPQPVEARPAARPAPRPVEPRERQAGPGPGSGAAAEHAEPFGRPAGALPSAGNAAPPKIPAAPVEKRRRSGNGEGRGWVADLLRRASSQEEKELAAQAVPEPSPEQGAVPGKRSPAQVVESLNSLSIDIARAIDHEASVELWDRYKRGERNVFTRRLYTLQGQRTFDELRRKYERDNDFRQAVDNYIGDFERLLAQVSKDDADPAMGRMYLTSDTGKVYTMLAHAAGRLS
jgi:hypothetical protein